MFSDPLGKMSEAGSGHFSADEKIGKAFMGLQKLIAAASVDELLGVLIKFTNEITICFLKFKKIGLI